MHRAHRETVHADETAVAYTVAGDPDAPPIVLLHGGGFDAAMVSWRDVRPLLAESFRVYALDWPGYGESEPPERSPTTEYYIGVLDGFLDAVGVERPSLVGVSLGGAIAIGYALSRPERVHRLVAIDSYGLGGSVPGGSAAAAVVRSPLLGALWWAIRNSRLLAFLCLRAAVHPPNLTDELYNDVLRQLHRPNATAAWQAFQRAEIRSEGLRTNYAGKLSDLLVPTLFVHGEHDALIPVARAVRAATVARSAELRVVPSCGHWVPRERPEELVATITPFLGRTENERGE